ncbi:hypothetical protein ACHAP7_009998 [Fusarium lateritium]
MCYITIHRTLCEECSEILAYRKDIDLMCNSKRNTNRCNVQIPPTIETKREDPSNCLVCVARRDSLEAARNAEMARREELSMRYRMEEEAEMKEEEDTEGEAEVKQEPDAEKVDIKDEYIKEEYIKDEEESDKVNVKKEEDTEMEDWGITKKFEEDEPKMRREKNGRVEKWVDGVLESKRKPGVKEE